MRVAHIFSPIGNWDWSVLFHREMAPSLGKLVVYPSGILFLGGAIAFYGLQLNKVPLGNVHFANIFSTSAPTTQVNSQVLRDEETQEECDCLPLWHCMTSGQDDCSKLELELRQCMERNKVGNFSNL